MDTNKQVGEGEQKDPFQPTNQALFSARSGAVSVEPYHVRQGFAGVPRRRLLGRAKAFR